MYKAGTVAVMVSDIERSIQFYTEKLGLTLRLPGDHWAEVQAPGFTIGLHQVGDNDPKPGASGSISIGFQVENLEPAMGTLRDKGIQFGPQIVDEGNVRLAFFADPDGNLLYLAEVKRP